jgi:hypothetical protein
LEVDALQMREAMHRIKQRENGCAGPVLPGQGIFENRKPGSLVIFVRVQ